MKLIIDIPEEDYIKANAGILGSIGEIIANGIPYKEKPNCENCDLYFKAMTKEEMRKGGAE